MPIWQFVASGFVGGMVISLIWLVTFRVQVRRHAAELRGFAAQVKWLESQLR